MGTALNGAFLSANMMVNNSVPQNLVGSANGIAMCIAAIARLKTFQFFNSQVATAIYDVFKFLKYF